MMRNTILSAPVNYSSIPVLSACNKDILDELFRDKEIREFRRGQKLLSQGDQYSGIYWVFEGNVKISKFGVDNKEFILWIDGPGEIYGFDSYGSEEGGLFSVTAVGNVKACFIPENELSGLLKQYPAVLMRLMQWLCEKIDRIEKRFISVARKKLREQLAEVLVSLASKKERLPDNAVEMNYTIQDLAGILGTTKNYLYKIIADFNEKNLVCIQNRRLKIKNIEKLALVATGELG